MTSLFIQEMMKLAAEEAIKNMADGKGGPFGAVVVKDGKVIGVGSNRVVRDNDPTAHAEICAIRQACQNLGDFRLSNCEIYTTCEPCPMCLAAIYWARIEKIYFASTRFEAAAVGFDDADLYKEVSVDIALRKIPMIYIKSEEGEKPLLLWNKMEGKTPY